MIRQYRKVIKHKIEINESILVKLIDRAKRELPKDGITPNAENIFEEVFFTSDDDEINIKIDDIPYSILEVETYFYEDTYNFIYNMIHDFVTEYVKKENKK